jgi:hypothetical protein
MTARPNLKWLKILPLFILVLALAACQPAEEPVTPFMEGTPFAPADPTEPDPLATPALTPEVVGTPIMVDTPDPTPAAVDTPAPVDTSMVTPEVVETPEMVDPDVDAAVIERDVTVIVRASDLIGMDVVDQQGETIGDVSEVLVDADGAIAYIFFDAGGFLGIGTRTTAVTWNALEIRSERHTMMLRPGAPTAPPAGAQPGTPGATPPSGTEPQPATPGATPAPGTGAQPGVGVGVDRTNVIVLDQTAVLVYRHDAEMLQTATEVDPGAIGRDTFIVDRRDLGLERRDPAGPARPHADRLMPLTWFTGLTGSVDLVNHQGENLGNVTDLIVVLQPGEEMRPAARQQQEGEEAAAPQPAEVRHLRQDDGFILYAVVDFGGFLGIGATTVLVPWEMIEIDVENEQLIVDVDRQTLENVPTHEWASWRDPLEPTWDEQISIWWQERGWTPLWDTTRPRTQP